MRHWLILLLFIAVLQLSAQSNPQNIGTGILFSFGMGGQIPAGDIADRFGTNLNFGGSLELITAENNMIYGLQGYYIFGSNIKENPLSILSDPNGFVIGSDGSYADIQLGERGYYIGGMIGKLFSLSPTNPRTGIRVTLGAGLLQHQIRIQDDPIRFVPQLSEAYKKGYDRLTNGLALNEFIGYQMLSTNKRINFYVGLEFTQGFTQNRRDYNFDTRSADTEQRFDLLMGIRAGWILPFYIGKGTADIYY